MELSDIKRGDILVAYYDESTWKGQNLLGKVLDEVREMIIAEKTNGKND
jgi:predicted NAD-dependent protein-ADP-ribosyltransferase YbiA (DUF1768 family)